MGAAAVWRFPGRGELLCPGWEHWEHRPPCTSDAGTARDGLEELLGSQERENESNKHFPPSLFFIKELNLIRRSQKKKSLETQMFVFWRFQGVLSFK